MYKRITYLLLISFIFCYADVQAQDSNYDSSYVSMDTVSAIEDEGINDEAAYKFETITEADKEVIVSREVNENAVRKMQQEDDFWYVNEAPVKEKPKAPSESFLDKLAKKEWFRNLLWFLVVGGFVAVLIWFLISSDIQLFKKGSPSIINTQEDELINQSIFDIDYDAEIQKAIANQNLRLAVRLLFLQTLRNLSANNIINYKQERTNSDYLQQLFNTTYYKDFFRLTRHFEYVWYGQFPITSANFDVIKNDFFTFKQRYSL